MAIDPTMDEISYEDIAKGTGISIPTLKGQINMDFWKDTINMALNPSQLEMQTYVVCALVEFRATTQKGEPFMGSYQETFEGWTEEDFRHIGRAFKRELLNVLNMKGITPLRQDRTHAEQLYDILIGTANVED